MKHMTVAHCGPAATMSAGKHGLGASLTPDLPGPSNMLFRLAVMPGTHQVFFKCLKTSELVSQGAEFVSVQRN